jgi:hypothetical protein
MDNNLTRRCVKGGIRLAKERACGFVLLGRLTSLSMELCGATKQGKPEGLTRKDERKVWQRSHR